MSDITERLRRLYRDYGTNYVQEAADEITRLRAEVEALRADAERWRFVLRQIPSTLGTCFLGDPISCPDEDIIEAVDAARGQP